MGLPWSVHETLVPENIRTAPAGQGLYLLFDACSEEIISLGQAGNCAERLLELSKKSWDGGEVRFSCTGTGKTLLPHQLREMENDLIGNFFERFLKAPVFQFRTRA